MNWDGWCREGQRGRFDRLMEINDGRRHITCGPTLPTRGALTLFPRLLFLCKKQHKSTPCCLPFNTQLSSDDNKNYSFYTFHRVRERERQSEQCEKQRKFSTSLAASERMEKEGKTLWK